MPYKKVSSRRFKKKPFSRKQVKAIKKIADNSGEVKFEDDSAVNTNLRDTSNNQHNLTGVVQGDNQSERIGMKVKLQRLMIKASVVSTQPRSLRMYVIYFPSDANVTLGELDDILPNEFYPRDTDLPRYQILWDRCYSLDANKGFTIKKSIDLKGRVQSYSDTTANAINGDLFVIYTTDNQTASAVSVDSHARLLYTDV